MLCAIIMVAPVAGAASIDSLWIAVLILGLATAGHQAFAANLFAFPSDVYPRKAVGSATGIGGAVGAVGGMLMAKYAGHVLQTTGTYTPIFVACPAVYVLAVVFLHLLTPRMTPVINI
jgi:ACS family hexuronate transporter-like MFS transporter